MAEEGFEIMGNHDCAICPVLTRCEKITRLIEFKLWERHLYTIAVAFPIVAQDEARFRIIVNDGHTFEDIEELVKGFYESAMEAGYYEKYGITPKSAKK
jgi:7-keto-8-aminopelargonate synthetase-like enzyme